MPSWPLDWLKELTLCQTLDRFSGDPPAALHSYSVSLDIAAPSAPGFPTIHCHRPSWLVEGSWLQTLCPFPEADTETSLCIHVVYQGEETCKLIGEKWTGKGKKPGCRRETLGETPASVWFRGKLWSGYETWEHFPTQSKMLVFHSVTPEQPLVPGGMLQSRWDAAEQQSYSSSPRAGFQREFARVAFVIKESCNWEMGTQDR